MRGLMSSGIESMDLPVRTVLVWPLESFVGVGNCSIWVAWTLRYLTSARAKGLTHKVDDIHPESIGSSIQPPLHDILIDLFSHF